MKKHLQKLCSQADLSPDEARDAMRTIMDGRATDAQIGAFLVALKTKGETPAELLAFVEVMRERCVKVKLDDPAAIDLCGTGGDGSGTFNISTAASFVVAGAGVTVAKHGNRSVSSSCGSADVLVAMGVNVELAPEKVEACVNGIGIGFLFAPLFHPSLRHAARARGELGMKTCFNLLGPLTNPAGVRRQLVGAYDRTAAQLMANVFAWLGSECVYVVHSEDGLDEVSLSGPTEILEVRGPDACLAYTIDRAALGLPHVLPDEIRGNTSQENAAIILAILQGEKGPRRDVTVANAAYGILSSGKAASPTDAVAMAQESIDSGRAMDKLNLLRQRSHA
jgi:anthranilate phosphoribosyltransferase